MGREQHDDPEAATSGHTRGEVAFAIDALREEMGLSIPDLAYRADMDADHLWELVNGRPMLASEAARLCMAMAHVLLAAERREVAAVA
jgi:hypothetical protein